MNSKLLRAALIAVALITAAVAAVYFQAPQGAPLFDDNPLLKFACNDSLSQFTLDSGCAYRPVRHLSFALDGTLWGPNNFAAHHIVNVVLHGLTALALFLLFTLLQGRARFGAALIAALLFAVHPAQVDAVAYVSGRRDVLCGLFFIASLFAYVLGRRRDGGTRAALWFGALLLWLLALGSKEMAVTLPLLVVWYEFSVGASEALETSDGANSAPSIRERLEWVFESSLKPLLPVLALAAGFAVYRGLIRPKSHLMMQEEWWGGSIWTNLLTSLSLNRYFAEVVFFPVRLTGDWHPPMVSPVESVASITLWVGVSILVLLVLATIRATTSGRDLVALGLGWYLLSLLPVSQLIPHHEIFAEHYLYIPLAGICLAVSGLLGPLLDSERSSIRKIAFGVSAILLVVFGLRAHFHVRDYRSPLAMANATLRWEPNHPRALLRAGTWLAENNRWDDAEGYLVAALDTTASDKLRARAYRMLGLHYLSEGELERVARLVNEGLADFPNDPNLKGLKGELLRRYGQPEQGLRLLTAAARHEDSVADIDFLAAMAHRQLGNADQAVSMLQDAVRKAERGSESRQRYMLALAHMLRNEHPQRAMKLIDQVLAEDPDNQAAKQLEAAVRAK